MFILLFIFTLMNARKILSDNIIPKHYSLLIDTKEDTFYGSVSIRVTIEKPTNILKLNAYKIDINDVEIVTEGDTIKKEDIELSEDDQVLVISLKQSILGEAHINFIYNGKISNSMNGYYVSKYKASSGEERLYSTHFEATCARRVVPSFDQPDMKATFDVILTVPSGLTALSNMDEALNVNLKNFISENNTDEKVNPNRSEKQPYDLNHMQYDLIKSSTNENLVFFNTTPKMSTYLLAFVLGKIAKKQTKLDDILINVYAPIGEEEDADYALDITKRCLDYYQNYFQIKYPLPKLDNIAIPNFAMGAMENWGLVTYRTSSLLYGKNSSLQTKKTIAETVCHELAHQWFGNLVTMKWWNDLWLNEGFATWASYKAVEQIEQEFTVTDFINSEKTYGISYDALNSTHAISVEVNDPKEIDQIFDGIVYSKGACLINMLEDFLGNGFEKGLVEYLKNNEYGNAETNDLWDSLGVEKLMNDWVIREGIPMVEVEESEEYLVLRQKRFLYVPDYQYVSLNGKKDSENETVNNKDAKIQLNNNDLIQINDKKHSEKINVNNEEESETISKQDDTDKLNQFGKRSSSDNLNPKSAKASPDIWKIPIRISFYGEGTELNELYMFETEEMKIKKKSETYKLNNESAGYYITHYKNKEMIKKLLRTTKLGDKDRLNLLNDTFNLIKASIIPIKEGLDLLPLYKDETNNDIMSNIICELSDIKSIFYKDEKQRQYLESTLLEIVSNRIDVVFDNITGEGLKYNEMSLYTSILNTAVNNEDKNTIRKLAKCFEGYKKDKSTIHPNYRGAMFISLMKRYNNDGEEDLFDELYELFINEKSDDVKNGMLLALGASNNFKFLSTKLLDDTIKTQNKMYLFAALANNIVTRDDIIAFTISNYKKIQEIYEDNSSLLGFIVERVFGIISHRQLRDKTIEFLKNADIEEISRAVKKCLEKSEIKIRFRESNMKEFE